MEVQSLYIHAAGSIGLDAFSSSDIEDLLVEDFDITAVGFPFHYGLRAGFRNIAQFELCKSSTSAHTIGTSGLTIDGIVSTSVDMKLKATDYLFKVNPFVWSWAKTCDGKPDQCLFLILGTGDAEYRDNTGDGFDGSGMIYGLEWAAISKYISVGVGATYQTITFDTTRVFSIDIPYEVKAKRFLIYARMGIGFGV